MVALYGRILTEIDGRICLNVDPELGDAKRYGFEGEMWLARRKCRGVIEAKAFGELDIVHLDEHIAAAKAKPIAGRK